MKQLLAVFISLCLCFCTVSCTKAPIAEDPVSEEELEEIREQALEDESTETEAEKPQIIIVGDSTADHYVHGDGTTMEASEGRDLMGWGYYLSFYLNEDYECAVHSKSGASSLSYTQAHDYDELLAELDEGDYVLLQFSHNDRATDERGTDATVPYTETDSEGKTDDGTYSYQGVLYHKFIRPIQNAGAIPVLLSPTVPRNNETGRAFVSDSQRRYTQSLKELADALDLYYLEVSDEVVALYDSLVEEGGAAKTAPLHAFTDETRQKIDISHLSHLGAYTIAGVIAELLAEEIGALSDSLLETPIEYVAK